MSYQTPLVLSIAIFGDVKRCKWFGAQECVEAASVPLDAFLISVDKMFEYYFSHVIFFKHNL